MERASGPGAGSCRRRSGRAAPGQTPGARPGSRAGLTAPTGETRGNFPPASRRSPGRQRAPARGTATALRNRTRTSRSQTERRSGGRVSINDLSAAFLTSSGADSSSARRLHLSSARPSPKSTFRSRAAPRKRRVARRRELLLKPIPGRGLRRLAPAGQGIGQAGDHLRLEFFRAAGRRQPARAFSGPGRSRSPRRAAARSAGARSAAGSPSPVATSASGSASATGIRPVQIKDGMIVVGVVFGSREQGLRPAPRAG